jgi:hypothetical protein
VVAGGKGIDLVEVVSLDPVLKLAGLVAGVGAYFEHGYDYDLYGDGARLGCGDSGQGGEKKGAKMSSARHH